MFINIDDANKAGLDIEIVPDESGNQCLSVIPRSGHRLEFDQMASQLREIGLGVTAIDELLGDFETSVRQAGIWAFMKKLDISQP